MTENKQYLEIQRLYLKDLSFESPCMPEIFKQKWQPEVKLDLNMRNILLENEIYEVELFVTVTAKMDDKVIFLAEVKQAGIFKISGFTEEQRNHIIGAYCPNALFPYVREVISSVISRASFPPLVLTPVNFDAIYAQELMHKQNEKKKQ